MAKRMKVSAYLKNATSIPMECSDVESDELYDSDGELLERQRDPQGNDDNSTIIESSDEEIADEDNMDQSSDSDCENIPNKRTRRCMRLPSSSEDEGGSEVPNQQTEIASDGTVWKRIEEGGVAGRLPVESVFKDVTGPTAHAKRNIMKGNLSSAFLLLIDNHILEHVRICTELEASRVLGKNWTITQAKLKAFLAILYARGAYEVNTLRLQYLWNNKWGPSFFSSTMSRRDFTEILRYIRFDKRNERSQRLQTDKFALVSAVWDKFIENSRNCFKPGAYITVDEQLFPTKARCKFTQYMPNKPHKFGIKFWLASDVQTKYVISGFPYLGKDEARNASTPLSEFVVMKLVEQYTGKGRTVTTDNFFTSIPLALKLRSKKTSLLGTIRANKRELPKICKLKKDSMARFSTLLYQSNGCTLTVYKSKPNKKVLIISTKHKHVKIDKTAKKLPETVSFYNTTKFGVDVTDQMARKYTVKSGSRRWPLQVFFNILDLAGINCWILYKNTTGENISRKDFLFRLAEELASEYQTSRQKPHEADILTTSGTVPVRKWCQIGYCNNNKTTNICNTCKKNVCGKCTHSKIYICRNCDRQTVYN
jgi:hypothetical protein